MIRMKDLVCKDKGKAGKRGYFVSFKTLIFRLRVEILPLPLHP